MRHSRGVMKFPLFLLVLALATIGAGVYVFARVTQSSPWKTAFYEADPPKIEWTKTPKGVGTDAVNLILTVSDTGAGLDEVIVRMEQKENRRDLLKKTFDRAGIASEDIVVPLDTRGLALKEGDLLLTVSAFDKSLWSNSAKNELKLKVDFTKPRVEVLTAQQNAALGGTEFVFYRVVGRAVESSGVEFGSSRYPGYPASDFDASFKGYSDVYAALFPVPFDFDDSAQRMRVFIQDDFGNRTAVPFNYRVARKRFPADEIKLTPAFISSKAAELLPELGKSPSGDPAEDFRAINETLREATERRVREILSNGQPGRLWKGVFIRPLAAAPKAGFAERRTYTLEGAPVSTSLHMGADLAGIAQSAVTAAATGRVAFAGPLGIYGYAVVLDHGFGLATIYGHLSTISVKGGDTVEASSLLGNTGATGLAGGDHLHYEVRLHGVPVTPIEWWDGTWVRDHIDDKAASVKRTLIGGSAE